jgi:hypothetical protein
LTGQGKKAGIKLSHPQGMTVCTLENQTIFEIKITQPNALKASAELYTPTCFFIKYMNASASLARPNGEPLQLNCTSITRNTFDGYKIGVWVKSNGSISICCH